MSVSSSLVLWLLGSLAVWPPGHLDSPPVSTCLDMLRRAFSNNHGQTLHATPMSSLSSRSGPACMLAFRHVLAWAEGQ